MKFNEVLQKLRKDQKISQEELAEQLGISRQAIAKWENGTTFPDIQNLIGLSEIFCVTIDSLVKEQTTCANQTVTTKDIQLTSLLAFVKEANDHTYAAGMNRCAVDDPHTHKYAYTSGAFTYIDCFVGGTQFYGQIIVTKDEEPIWSMLYDGRTLSKHFSSDFLKEVLLQMPSDLPIRGTQMYKKGEHVYHNDMLGDFTWFHGKERIFYEDDIVYEGRYFGGYVK